MTETAEAAYGLLKGTDCGCDWLIIDFKQSTMSSFTQHFETNSLNKIFFINYFLMMKSLTTFNTVFHPFICTRNPSLTYALQNYMQNA